MNWTSTKPTAPGYYWFRTTPTTEELCRVVYYGKDQIMAHFTDGERNNITELTEGQWYGPIAVPEAPP